MSKHEKTISKNRKNKKNKARKQVDSVPCFFCGFTFFVFSIFSDMFFVFVNFTNIKFQISKKNPLKTSCPLTYAAYCKIDQLFNFQLIIHEKDHYAASNFETSIKNVPFIYGVRFDLILKQ